MLGFWVEPNREDFLTRRDVRGHLTKRENTARQEGHVEPRTTIAARQFLPFGQLTSSPLAGAESPENSEGQAGRRVVKCVLREFWSAIFLLQVPRRRLNVLKFPFREMIRFRGIGQIAGIPDFTHCYRTDRSGECYWLNPTDWDKRLKEPEGIKYVLLIGVDRPHSRSV